MKVIRLIGIFICCRVVSAQTIDTTASGTVIWHGSRPSTGLMEKGKFLHGQRHGVWMYYNAQKSLVLKEKYKHGKRVWAFFYRDQKIIATVDRTGILRKRPDCGC